MPFQFHRTTDTKERGEKATEPVISINEAPGLFISLPSHTTYNASNELWSKHEVSLQRCSIYLNLVMGQRERKQPWGSCMKRAHSHISPPFPKEQLADARAMETNKQKSQDPTHPSLTSASHCTKGKCPNPTTIKQFNADLARHLCREQTPLRDTDFFFFFYPLTKQ